LWSTPAILQLVTFILCMARNCLSSTLVIISITSLGAMSKSFWRSLLNDCSLMLQLSSDFALFFFSSWYPSHSFLSFLSPESIRCVGILAFFHISRSSMMVWWILSVTLRCSSWWWKRRQRRTSPFVDNLDEDCNLVPFPTSYTAAELHVAVVIYSVVNLKII